MVPAIREDGLPVFIFVSFVSFVVNQFSVSNDYQLVQLANGEKTLFSSAYGAVSYTHLTLPTIYSV